MTSDSISARLRPVCLIIVLWRLGPVIELDQKGRPVANTSSSDPLTDAARSARISAMAAIAAAVFSLIGVVAAVWIGISANQTSKDNEIRDTRMAAYSEFVESLTEFHEFVWDNLRWVGTDDDRQPPPSDEAAFFQQARELQAKIESAYWMAKVVAEEDQVKGALNELRSSQGDVLLQFKCMGNIQKSNCLDIKPASQDEIAAMLESTRESTKTAREVLATEAETQLLR